jgi:hypothetical protein
MITPIIVQNSSPAASVQQNTEAQSFLNTQNAQTQVEKNERMLRESVVQKDEAVFYEQHHDAKEEGKNKYQNLYGKKKKSAESEEKTENSEVNRVNFDIKI